MSDGPMRPDEPPDAPEVRRQRCIIDPPTTTALAGMPTSLVRGRIFLDGVTTQVGRGFASVQVGFGPPPTRNTMTMRLEFDFSKFTWIEASYEQDANTPPPDGGTAVRDAGVPVDGPPDHAYDEYRGRLFPEEPGSFAVVFRFSKDGHNYEACIETNEYGRLEVSGGGGGAGAGGAGSGGGGGAGAGGTGGAGG